MTGHPIVNLHLSTKSKDAAIFVYLEEVDKEGNVYQVTEGQLRLSHRTKDQGIYKELGPSRSHNKSMELPLEKDIMEVELDLLPISWEFKKGSSIRISLTGGDKDIFEIINPDGYEMGIHFGQLYPSRITLPIYNQ